MGALTSPLKSGLSGGGQRGGQGHVGEGSVRPTRCELPPLLGVGVLSGGVCARAARDLFREGTAGRVSISSARTISHYMRHCS